ncbi:MAG: hypothetical protein J6I85_08015 [Clostridia bacterium]|nr:hypothetical protein [Clostridia bacterium]
MPNIYRINIPQNENRGGNFPPPNSKKTNNKKYSFKSIKKNTIKSLNEVEYFLNNFSKLAKCIKIYKIIK